MSELTIDQKRAMVSSIADEIRNPPRPEWSVEIIYAQKRVACQEFYSRRECEDFLKAFAEATGDDLASVVCCSLLFRYNPEQVVWENETPPELAAWSAFAHLE